MRWLLIVWLGLLVAGQAAAGAKPDVTSYARMESQLKADASHCPQIRIFSIGKSAGGKKDLWLVRVCGMAQNPSQTLRLLVMCRQHGDEPASTEALLGLIHRVAEGGDPQLRGSLSHITLYIIPMVNPDGADANARSNAVGADLNRDWGIFHQPETRAVAAAAKLICPNVVIDAHNWDGNDEYNADCLEVPRESSTSLGKLGHTLQQLAVRQLALCGYTLHPTAWGSDADPHLAHRWFTQQGIASALVETHFGEPSDSGDFQRRQGMYVALIHTLVNHFVQSSPSEIARLNRLEQLTSADVQEEKLFPPIFSARSVAVTVPRPKNYLWLWAFSTFGLALWGGIRRPEAQSGGRAEVGTVRLPRRYSISQKRDGTETRVRSGQRKAVSMPPR